MREKIEYLKTEEYEMNTLTSGSQTVFKQKIRLIEEPTISPDNTLCNIYKNSSANSNSEF